ncbi:MAG: (Fe-S)-binding protein [Caldimicrobium sp.]
MKKNPERCVRCGKCLPHCPSYTFFLKENYSPRGRNFLLSKEVDSKAFDYCLFCERCQQVCPNNLSFPEFLMEKLFAKNSKLLPHVDDPLTLLNFYPSAKKIIQKWEKTNIQDLSCDPLEGDIYLYLSCGTKHLYPNALKKVLHILHDLSIKAHLPEKQDCCGIIYLSLNAMENLRKFALNKLQIFSEKKPILTLCATCFWMLKKVYPKLFEDTEFAPFFNELSKRTYFILDFLKEKLHYNIELESKDDTLYHFPCHLKSPLTFVESYLKNVVKLRDFCCGSAKLTLWIHQFQQEFSNSWKGELLGKKVIATACTGCYLNFSLLLRRPPEIKHWCEFIK